ncbi:hypothetical protein BJF83_22480 [Nocardiopsis sp. CNR-923]|uniref:hypothetical protein n=1 Tax=Nocardiopsis sp. CNR-923 TaxID=1904965 RepID=UPI000960EF08|nr:hypothetical protein [Nocardiopsis sp. CNR-923]OLT25850.1 hypothetical protein BJF83_22480 [Nocardiopsis sp. CNR-923]
MNPSLLGKWPRLLVAGDPVTPDQADDIIIRTTPVWRLSYAQGQTRTALYDMFGLRPHPTVPDAPDLESVRAANAALGILGLNHLHNERIVSAWIGGLRGWCAWDGHIGASTYNVGPNPVADDVAHDLHLIAETWPHLNMRVQLALDDPDEGPTVPAISWYVHEGAVRVVSTDQFVVVPDSTVDADFDAGRHLIPARERVQAAVDRVAEVMAP